MNLARLRALQAELQRLQGELGALLIEAEGARDPLAIHIYQSRRRYNTACDRDGGTKHQRGVEEEIDRSFKAAMDLHFIGSRSVWVTILRSNEWTAKALRGSIRG